MRRAALAALPAALLLAACLTFHGPKGPPTGTYDERIEVFARLLQMEDRRYYDPLTVGYVSGSPDPWVRAKTALACGRLRDPDASPYLPVALRDPDAGVRRAAAFAIGVSGDARLARFLPPALADGDAETASNAAEALGKLGGEDAIAALLRAAAAPDGPRTAAAYALFRFPEDRVVRALSPLASGAAPPYRTALVYALARKPRPEALPVLRQALGGSTDVAPLAARALGILGDFESVPALVALVPSTDPGVAIQSLLALEKIGAKEKLGEPARRAALARSGDAFPGVAVAALRALGRFSADEEVAARLSAVSAQKGWRGQTALVALARVKGEAARPMLVAALGAKDLEPRLAVAEALGVLPPSAAKDLLPEVLKDASARVRALALGSAPKEVLEASRRLLVAALGDPDAAVREGALEAAAPFSEAPELAAPWRHAFELSFARGADADFMVGALDAAAERTDGGRALIEPRVDDHDPVLREKARRLMSEKFHTKGPYARIPIETGRSLADYRVLARSAIESRFAAKVTLARGGSFAIDLAAEDAPMTVASFTALARKGFFDGNTIHRVVPDFVVQAGDPRGDGSGGPGYAIRDEINPLRYRRAAVGMALSGPDTGGSQWFVTLAPQPHLDGGYTVFGAVVRGMEDVDKIEEDDVIAKLTIEERPREVRPAGFVR
jgi:cyclophilin family peptidyl-prolyl cis-trans isomerase/HEAT repeat protein